MHAIFHVTFVVINCQAQESLSEQTRASEEEAFKSRRVQVNNALCFSANLFFANEQAHHRDTRRKRETAEQSVLFLR